MSPQEPKAGDRVTGDPTTADEEMLPKDTEEEDEDEIVPGPLDEEDAGVQDEHGPLSNSVPGEDLPLDMDDGDPAAPPKPPFTV